MNPPTLLTIAQHLDELLGTQSITDYPNALNGIQLANRGAITRVAASVDVSRTVIERTIEAGANLLIVHHGMFWGGVQPLRGTRYERLRLLLEHDIAVYASHLPLDAHPDVGNNVLLARELGLEPAGGFAEFRGTMIGVRGEASISTLALLDRARTFAQRHGGDTLSTAITSDRMTRRWAICTGAGATAETLAEASTTGVDTLIVGEGPHWTAVDAPEEGIVIMYAGHYATETLGVRALAQRIAATYDLPWSFIKAPTGL
jgi:dinuclear metal center YbgI/SA1388 family protein